MMIDGRSVRIPFGCALAVQSCSSEEAKVPHPEGSRERRVDDIEICGFDWGLRCGYLQINGKNSYCPFFSSQSRPWNVLK
jgi:hypothetical protein